MNYSTVTACGVGGPVIVRIVPLLAALLSSAVPTNADLPRMMMASRWTTPTSRQISGQGSRPISYVAAWRSFRYPFPRTLPAARFRGMPESFPNYNGRLSPSARRLVRLTSRICQVPTSMSASHVSPDRLIPLQQFHVLTASCSLGPPLFDDRVAWMHRRIWGLTWSGTTP